MRRARATIDEQALVDALDGIGPKQINLASLVRRAAHPGVKEVILAMDATVEGQTTARLD